MAKYKDIKSYIENSTTSLSNVQKGETYWKKQLLNKCMRLFVYENLPETLPSFELEKVLIVRGMGAVIESKGKLYAPFTGSVFGVDEYYRGNRYTFAQPVIGGGTFEDGKKCAIIFNDSTGYTSLTWELIERYARFLADIESSLYGQLINARGGRLGVAQNSATKDAVDMVYKKLEFGEATSILNPSAMMDTWKPSPIGLDTVNLSMFTELRDYAIKSFMSELGINKIDEKKERMVTGEISADDTFLHANIEDMYLTRVNNVEWINHVFGTNITVRKRDFMEYRADGFDIMQMAKEDNRYGIN